MAVDNIYPPVRFANKGGRPLNYTPEELATKFDEYVRWCQDNPIVLGSEEKSTAVDGTKYGKQTIEQKPRLVSIGGFLVYIGEDMSWWHRLDTRKAKEKFIKVKGYIREFCESYQKEMASAGIFNGNIISRLLGLADKQAVTAEVDYKFKFGDE